MRSFRSGWLLLGQDRADPLRGVLGDAERPRTGLDFGHRRHLLLAIGQRASLPRSLAQCRHSDRLVKPPLRPRGPAARRPLAPYACDPAQSRGRRHPEPESALRSPFPARSRPDRPQHRVPPARVQDPGVRQPRGRPFPHPPDPHPGGRADRPHRGARAAPSTRIWPRRWRWRTTSATARSAMPARRRSTPRWPRYGGFDHNAQTLRVVTHLERRYAGFDGLNLTWETLEGVVKHNGPFGGPFGRPSAPPAPAYVAAYAAEHDLELASHPSAEAQVAALADDIAYINHDLDDGLRAGLFALEDLAAAAAGRADLRGGAGALSRARAAAAGARDPAPADRRDGGRPGRGDRRGGSRRCSPPSVDDDSRARSGRWSRFRRKPMNRCRPARASCRPTCTATTR